MTLYLKTAFPIARNAAVIEHASARQKLEEEVISLFDQSRDPLLRYLQNVGVALPDGEEIVQEVFLSLFQHLRAGKPRDNLRGWLFRVAHNLALKERYRTRRNREALTEMLSRENLAVDSAPSPEQRLLAETAQQRLQAVVSALSELDRKCLFLRAEGLRYREICKILDISLGSVSLSLARSLARIARAAER
jgi:RNA polymerase sigma-70 factor (ECF subfamily)